MTALEKFRSLLSTFTDEQLALFAAGIDPEGGTVPPEAVRLAQGEQRRRKGKAAARWPWIVAGVVAVVGVGAIVVALSDD